MTLGGKLAVSWPHGTVPVMPRTALQPGYVGPVTITRYSDRGRHVWRARARWRDLAGGYHYLTRVADTKAEAAADYRDGEMNLLARLQPRVYGSKATMRDVARLWLGTLPGADLAKETKREYTTMCQKYMVNGDTDILDKPISEVTPGNVTDYLSRIGVEHGAGSGKMMLSLCRNVFGYAVSYGMIASNPSKDAVYSQASIRKRTTRKPKYVKDHRRAFDTGDEAIIDLEIFADEKLQATGIVTVMQIMKGTGARISEVLDMQWRMIDFRKHTIFLPGTKTGTSPRTVAAPQWLLDVLKRLSETTEHASTDYVTPGRFGGRRDGTAAVKAVSRAFETHGLTWATSHTFRRTVATKLFTAGMDIRQVANHLGHKNISTTQNFYLDRTDTPGDAGRYL